MDESQDGIKIPGRNISNLRYADDTTLITERKEELKSTLMRVKGQNEKADLKHNIIKKEKKLKVIASIPITSWQIEREKVGTVTDFIFLASKITVDGDCNHKIKRRLLLRRKPMTNHRILSRDITLLTRICLVKAVVFPVVIYGCESWTIKNGES